MTLSKFWFLMKGEFGENYAHVLADTLVLGPYQLTASQALSSGISPAEIWHAVCDQQEVPEHRRLGRDIPPAR